MCYNASHCNCCLKATPRGPATKPTCDECPNAEGSLETFIWPSPAVQAKGRAFVPHFGMLQHRVSDALSLRPAASIVPAAHS